MLSLSASADTLTLYGASQDAELELRVAAEGGATWQAALPAVPAVQLIGAQRADTVRLGVADGQLELEAGAARAKLALSGTPASFTHPPGGDGVTVAADDLAAALAVGYAASAHEYQVVFRAIKLELRASALRAVATDGFRIARSDVPAEGVGEGFTGADVLLPARLAPTLLKAVRGAERVTLVPTRSHLVITAPGVRAAFAQLEGVFPDYARVIPSAFVLEARLAKAELLALLARLEPLADTTKGKRVDLLFDGGTLHAHAEGAYGHAEDRLTYESVGGTAPTGTYDLAFNLDFVRAAAAGVPGDELIIKLSDGGATPTALTHPPAAGREHLALVVPLKRL